jgi:hypothetical protein
LFLVLATEAEVEPAPLHSSRIPWRTGEVLGAMLTAS